MIKRLGMSLALCGMTLTSACATVPTAVSHEHVSADGTHWAVQVSMHTGIPNTPIQTVMVLYNKYQRTPIATVSGQTKPLGEKLADDLIHLVSTVGASAITGNYILRASEAECPTDALCGTLVQVSNSAGANSAADASSAAGS